MPCTLENLVVRDANMNYDASTWNLEQRGRVYTGWRWPSARTPDNSSPVDISFSRTLILCT